MIGQQTSFHFKKGYNFLKKSNRGRKSVIQQESFTFCVFPLQAANSQSQIKQVYCACSVLFAAVPLLSLLDPGLYDLL